jgi:hypothetical protein
MNKNMAIKTLFLSFVCSIVFAQTVEDTKPIKADKEMQEDKNKYKVKQSYENRFTKWMPNDSFHELYSKKHEEKYFTVVLEGRLISEEGDGHIKGDWEYRAIFEKMPVSSFFYYVEWGRRQNKYTELAEKYKKGGYEILFSQSFKDVIEEDVTQAIWVRKDQVIQAKKILQKILQ